MDNTLSIAALIVLYALNLGNIKKTNILFIVTVVVFVNAVVTFDSALNQYAFFSLISCSAGLLMLSISRSRYVFALIYVYIAAAAVNGLCALEWLIYSQYPTYIGKYSYIITDNYDVIVNYLSIAGVIILGVWSDGLGWIVTRSSEYMRSHLQRIHTAICAMRGYQ